MEELAFGCRGDAGSGVGGLLLREFVFCDFAGEVLVDGAEAAVEKGLLDIAEEDVEAGAGADVGDAVAHGSGAEDCDGFDFRHREVRAQQSSRD